MLGKHFVVSLFLFYAYLTHERYKVLAKSGNILTGEEHNKCVTSEKY